MAVGESGTTAVVGFRLAEADGVVRRTMVLRTFDENGVHLWSRSWRPKHGSLWPADIAIGPDGSVVVAGRLSTERLGEAGGAFLRRYSSTGALLWARTSLGWRAGEVYEAATGVAVGPGLVVVSGEDYGCCGDSYVDGFVRAYDLDGTLAWENPFEPPGLRRTHDGARAVAIAPSGAVYAAGWVAMGPESLGAMADHEILVQRLSANGERVWSRIVRHRRHANPETAVAVTVGDRGLFVAGTRGGNWRRWHGHAWLADFTLGGRVTWTREWGQRASDLATAASVAEGLHGTILVTGTQLDSADGGSDVFLRGYSTTGTERWRLTIGRGAGYLHGTDVSANDVMTCVTGYRQGPHQEDATKGWIWCFEG